MNFPLLLLIVSSVLVLKSGERIEVVGAVQEQNGRAIFRVAGGPLYSIPLAEIDEPATKAAAEAKPPAETTRKLRVSAQERDRLLRELQKSRGTQTSNPDEVFDRALASPPPKPPANEGRDEWSWRREARAHEEAIRRAEENLQMLRDRLEQLQGEINSFLSLGYHPRQFTYQTTTLQATREQIPIAELDVKRAYRAFDQFRDDARRQGVMPGWLR